MSQVVDPLVTFGYGPESKNLAIWGYGGGLIQQIVETAQSGARAATQVVKTTMTIIRLDIDHAHNSFRPRFNIGHFVIEPIHALFNISPVSKAVFEVVKIHKLGFKLASKLSRIITGSNNIGIKTGHD